MISCTFQGYTFLCSDIKIHDPLMLTMYNEISPTETQPYPF